MQEKKFPQTNVTIISFSSNPQNILSIYVSKLNLRNIPLDKPIIEFDWEIHSSATTWAITPWNCIGFKVIIDSSWNRYKIPIYNI